MNFIKGFIVRIVFQERDNKMQNKYFMIYKKEVLLPRV